MRYPSFERFENPFGTGSFAPLSGDLESMLLGARRLSLSGEITDERAHLLIAQLLALGAQPSGGRIDLLINSSGGPLRPSLAIYDVMSTLSDRVATTGTGRVDGSAALLLAAGAKGARCALPGASVVLALPDAEAIAQGGRLEARIEELRRDRDRFVESLARESGQEPGKIALDLEQHRVLTAAEALEYGLVDTLRPIPE